MVFDGSIRRRKRLKESNELHENAGPVSSVAESLEPAGGEWAVKFQLLKLKLHAPCT